MLQRIFFLLLVGLGLGACREQQASTYLKEGDILFQDLDCGPMCNAIEAVTSGVDGRDFSHCALVIRDKDSLKVIEAIGTKVQVTSLKMFLQRGKKVIVSRLKTEDASLISRAVTYAKSLEGKPYDEVFLLNNDRYYCSELIYEAFKAANHGRAVFELAPMTFKDPFTKEFYPVWLDYYHDLKCPIPEGKPGINPGSLSRSNLLEVKDVSF